MLKRKKPEPEPLLPLVSTNIVKFVLDNQREVLVQSPRATHFMDGKKWFGREVDAWGQITNDRVVVPAKSVTRTTPMSWDPNIKGLVEGIETTIKGLVEGTDQ
jgi:hypothetical protein